MIVDVLIVTNVVRYHTVSVISKLRVPESINFADANANAIAAADASADD